MTAAVEEGGKVAGCFGVGCDMASHTDYTDTCKSSICVEIERS